MAYTPYEWQDLPSTETPIVAEKLNHIENGIKAAHDDMSGVVASITEIDETISTLQSTLSETQTDVGELKTKATNTDIALAEIKLLGWTVPEECPIKNELNGNTFTQRVGRVDLGSLDWTKSGNGAMKSQMPPYRFASDTKAYNSTYQYDGVATSTYGIKDKTIKLYYQSDTVYREVYIYDTSYTDASSFKSAMQGKYLYYELATPITKNVDGNEILLIKQEFINPIYLGELVWQTSTAGKYYTLLPYSYNDIIFATIKDFGSLRANDNLQIALRANGKEILILSNTNTFYQGAYIGLSILHKG